MAIAEPPGKSTIRTATPEPEPVSTLLPAWLRENSDDRDSTAVEAGRTLRSAWRAAFFGQVSTSWRWVPLATMVLFFTAIGLEPAEAQQVETTTADWIIGGGLLLVMVMTYIAGSVSLSKGHRAGLIYTLPVTGFFLFTVITCPTSGHHAWGNWVYSSFAAGIGAAALHVGSVFATRGTNRDFSHS